MSECPMCDGQDIDCPICAADVARSAERPPMTAPDQPKAPPTQRVTDWVLADWITDFGNYPRNLADQAVLDLRDTRAALADAQTVLAASYARIAELERERIVDKSLRLPDALPFYVTQESYDGLAAQVDEQCKFLSRLMQRLPIPDDLPSLEDVANWIADRLEAQLQAARAAGRNEGLREAAQIADHSARCNAAAHDDAKSAKQREVFEARTAVARSISWSIRARLTAPAEPTADTGEKGCWRCPVSATEAEQLERAGWVHIGRGIWKEPRR